MIYPVQQVGGSRKGTVTASYNEILEKIGFEDNATELDDPSKVKASWGFRDDSNREAFLWLYKVYRFRKDEVLNWSADGDFSLLRELFPNKVSD